ncbi:MAG: LysR family transcriptional regulator [Myxococcota bacterium]|nr:LysR family transcriptional regulator [Myxococcota bacterium]
MFSRLPSLTALRTFEAAARHRSFKSAAQELSVTAPAVSRQVRALEEHFGVALFEREPRGVALTRSGRELFEAAHEALATLLDAAEALDAYARVLTVSVTPAFGALWLAPRLVSFREAHSDIEVDVHATTRPVGLAREGRIDLAVRYGARSGDPALLTEQIGVYGTPEVVERAAAGAEVPRLEARFREATPETPSWDAWLDLAGLRGTGPLVSFADEHHVVQAALAARGLALVSEVLVGDAVARGWLVSFHPDVRLEGGAYRLALPDERSPKVEVFARWIAAEVERAR